MIPMAPGFFRPQGDSVSYTKILLHFDGANDSTTFTDEITKTWTPQTGAKISTAQSYFGGSSMYTSGTGGIQTADSAFLEPLGQSWTIEFFARFASLSTAVLVTKRSTPAGLSPIHLTISGAGNSAFYIVNDGVNYQLAGTTGNILTTNTWYHFAIEFLAPYYLMWVNGTNYVAFNSGGSPVLSDLNTPWTIGADGDGTSPMDGWIDEFRYSAGIARYNGVVGSITVPAAPFVVD